MGDFDIFLDTDNELKFTVAIEGVGEAAVRSQFILEGPRGISLSFEGKAEGSEISVDVPTLKGMLREGVYNTRLEVIVDDRIFTPLQMQANLKPAIKVEAVVRAVQKSIGPVVTAAVASRPKQIVETQAPAAAAINTSPVKTAAQPATPPVRSTARAQRTFRSNSLDSLLDSLEGD